MTEILNAFLVNFDALLQTFSTGSAQLLGTIV